MATPADQRLLELLEKWLTSLELHLAYTSLDDESYAKVQPWPEHQRPSRWIIDLALQKAMALQSHVQEHIRTGDATFADSLELMAFLANLVGSEHIERFIPLASTPAARAALPSPDSDTATGTREMPQFQDGALREPAAPGTPHVARSERRQPDAKIPADRHAPSDRHAPAERGIASPDVREQVIADAARLVQWGRKWYELAELIAGMADRPSLTDVRRILQDNKTVIEKKAGRG